MIGNFDLAGLLKLYPILHELPPALKHSFSASCFPVHLRADEILFDASRPVGFILFLTSGSIRVIHLGLDREILLYRLQPGQICILSVCQLLGSPPFQARASTEQPVTGIAVPEALFVQFVEGSPLFCFYLLNAFSGQLVDLLALLDAVSFSRLDQRLAGLLLSKGTAIQATHSQLADDLGSVREVISRLLKEFENQGLVKLGRGKVWILNRPALEKIATYFGDSDR